MANNKEVEIKVTVDTKDATDGFKDIEKASDKMAKSVTQDADKVDSSLDEVVKTTKDIQSAFKNVNIKSLTSSLSNIGKQAKNIASNIRKQLTDAFNVKGSVQVNTTATSDASGGSNSGSAMSSAMSSIVSGGAIGAQIAKQLAQTKGLFSTTLKEMKSEVNATDLFENMDDSLIEQMNTIKNTVYPVIEHVKEAMAIDGVAFDYDFVDFTRGVENARFEVNVLQEELEQPLEMKYDALLNLKRELHELSAQVDNFSYGLSKSAMELFKLTLPRGKNSPLNNEEYERSIQLVNEMEHELLELERIGGQIGYIENLDFSNMELLAKSFKTFTNEANAQALIEELRQIQEEANKFGLSFSGIDKVMKEYEQVCANGGRLTKEFTSSLMGTAQQFTQYNAKLREAQKSQELQARKQHELATSSSNLSKSLISAKYGVMQFGNAVKSSFSQGFAKAQTHVTNLINKTREWVKTHKQASSQVKSANRGIATSFKSLLQSMLPFLSIYGAFNLIKQSITDAMGAIETSNMYTAVFGQNTKEMDKWIKEVNKTMGLGVGQTREYTAIIGQMGKAMGMSSDESMELAKSMATMAGDISSFYNVDIAQAQEDLRSALSGSNEVLTKYGIVLREDTIKQFAYANGIATVNSELSANQRAMALTMMVEQQLGMANGDLAKTMDTPAGRARRLSVALADLRTSLGNIVLPIWNAVMPGLIALANALTAVFNRIASVINGILSLFGLGIKGGGGGGGSSSSGGGLLGDVADSAGAIGSNLADGLSDAGSGSSKVADDLADASKSTKEIAKGLMGIDELNVLSSPDNGSGSGSSGGSGGSSGGSGGSGGLGGGGGLGGLGDVYDIVEEGSSIFDEISEEASAFVDAFKEIWSKIALGFLPYKQNILDQWNLLKLNLQTLGQEIVNFFTSCWENGGSSIAIHLGALSATIIETFLGISNVVVEALTDLFKHLNPENNEYVANFIKAFDDMILAIKRFVGQWDEWLQVLKDNGGQEFLDNMADICFILGTTFIDAVTDAIEALTDFLSEDDNQRVKDFGGALETISEALKSVSEWIQDNIGWLSTLGAIILGIVGGCKLAKGVIKAVQIAFQAWGWIELLIQGLGAVFSWLWTTILVPVGSAIMAGLGAIASFFGISVGWVIAIIAGLIATGVLLWKNWDTIVEKCKKLWENIKKWWSKIWDGICKWCQDISKTCKTKWEEIQTNIINKCKDICNNVKTKWNEIKQAIIDKCKEITTNTKNKFTEIKDAVVNKCKEIWNGIKSKWNEIKTAITTKCSEIITGVKTKWNEVKTAIINKCSEILTGAKNKFNEVKTAITTKIGEIKTNAQTKFTEIKTTIVDKFNQIKAPVEKAIGKVWSAIKPIVDKLKGAFNFKWKLPDLKLPHLSVTGGEAPFGLGGKGSLPKFSINKLCLYMETYK